ncbi:MAG: glycosyltransferase family 2 protein [Pseudomonadota bacterium]
MTHLAVLCVRNEAAFMLEWLAHHRATGFDDFLVFSNNCQDGTDLMLDRLEALGHLAHLRNDGPYDGRGIQFTALQQAAKHPRVKAADWILPLDIDEFVNIHVGAHRLPDLHAALPHATAITLTWRLFGSAAQVRYTDTPVLQTFTRCAPRIIHWPWRAAMFKTLYRNDGSYAKPGVHRPRSPKVAALKNAVWADGAGRTLPEPFKTKRIFSDYGRDNHALVQLNHYPLGALESYLLKTDRGRAVHSDDRLGMDYFVERNFNTDTDTSIAALAEPRATALAELMADPELARLHKQAVAWRHQRFEALMAEDAPRALFGRLLMTPPSVPLTRQQAQFLQRAAR